MSTCIDVDFNDEYEANRIVRSILMRDETKIDYNIPASTRDAGCDDVFF